MAPKKSGKCLVHLGQPKAGSTALQSALAFNRDDLLKDGLFYWQGFQPSFTQLWRDKNSVESQKDGGNYALSSPFLEKPPPFLTARGMTLAEFQETGERYWRIFNDSLSQQRRATTIVSTETLWHTPRMIDFIDRLQTVFDSVHVVIYLRNPVDHYPSGVSELLKGLHSLDRLVPSKWGTSPKAVVSRICQTLPEENVDVRPYVLEDSTHSDVVQDFFGVLSGLAGVNLRPAIRRSGVNRSLPGAYFAWLVLESGLYSEGEFRESRQTFLELAHFRRTVDRDPSYRDFSPLKIEGTSMEGAILRYYGQEWNALCDTYFSGSGRIRVESPEVLGLSRKTSNDEVGELVNWISGYRDEGLSSMLTHQWKLNRG